MPNYTLQYVYAISDFDTSGPLIAPRTKVGLRPQEAFLLHYLHWL